MVEEGTCPQHLRPQLLAAVRRVIDDGEDTEVVECGQRLVVLLIKAQQPPQPSRSGGGATVRAGRTLDDEDRQLWDLMDPTDGSEGLPAVAPAEQPPVENPLAPADSPSRHQPEQLAAARSRKRVPEAESEIELEVLTFCEAASDDGGDAGIELEELDQPHHHLQQHATTRTRAWEPGENCVGWLDRGHDMQLQTQVLLTNGYLRLGRMHARSRRAIRALVKPVGSLNGTTVCAQILSGLFCLPARTIENTVKHVIANKFCPSPRHAPSGPSGNTGRATQSAEAGEDCDQLPQDIVPMKNLVRLCLANAVAGRPHTAFPQSVNLIDLSGGVVGTVHHSKAFALLCETMASKTAKEFVGSSLSIEVPALGIPSDLELIADGATVGKYYSRSRDTLIMIGVVLSVEQDPGSMALFLDCPNESGDGRGLALAGHMLKTLRAPPFNITTEALQARLALCCGDGALVAGGPLAKHSSTSAMEKIWEQLRRPPRVCWDFFTCSMSPVRKPREQRSPFSSTH